MSDDTLARFARTLSTAITAGTIELCNIDGDLLAVFAVPQNVVQAGSVVRVTGIAATEALKSGLCSFAMLYDKNGIEMMRGDVGDIESEAFLRMDDRRILQGGTVELREVVIEIARPE